MNKRKAPRNKDSKEEEKRRGKKLKKNAQKKKKGMEGKSVKKENSKEFERAENNEKVLTPKAYHSLRAQILCDAQRGIQSLLPQINILLIPKPTLQTNDKPYMISFRIFSH